MTGVAVKPPVVAQRQRPGLRIKGEGRALVESLSHDGRGVAHVDGKTVFIEGALPQEEVVYGILGRKPRYDSAVLLKIEKGSAERVAEPPCPGFGTCGGCSLQHLDEGAQLRAKEEIVRDILRKIGGVAPDEWLEPIHGPSWGYRRRARLGVKLVPKKGGVLVGFREKRSAYITDIEICPVLDPRAGALIPALRSLVTGMSCLDRIPQIEIAAGDHGLALVFRHLVALTRDDQRDLRRFAETHGVQLWLQPGGPDSVAPFWPERPEPLRYALPEFDIEIRFGPTDFTQVNAEVNRLMVRRAIDLLALAPEDTVLDLFCGLGNFTLPLARHAGRVLGIEGDGRLVDGARENARRQRIQNADFEVGDLYRETATMPWGDFRFDKLLLDPPRSGAMEAIRHLPQEGGPTRVVYVSCYPATLARDAQYLVHQLGYRMQAACVMDMFPQTSHVEAIALFVKPSQ